MMRRHLAEESGAALGLAILLVVVTGVLGAGLLLVVQNDLRSVVESNRGQRAFYAADSGVQAAKYDLLTLSPPASEGCDSSEKSTKSGEVAGASFVVEVRRLCGSHGDSARFEVVSTGSDGDALRRRVEAVYRLSDVGAPLASYAAGDVRLEGVVEGGSVFSGGDAEGGGEVSGKDRVYGDWQTRASERASVAAVGSASGLQATLRYDSTTSPAFVASDPAEGEVSYPFDPDYWGASSRRALLEGVAREQDNYHKYNDSAADLSWPENSTEATMVYVEDPGGVVELSGCQSAPCLGTLFVEGGVKMESGVFRGVIVALDDATFESGATLEGFVNCGGDLDIEGEVVAPGRARALSYPALHGLKLVSWREVYE